MEVLLGFLQALGAMVVAPALIGLGTLGVVKRFEVTERGKATERLDVASLVCRLDADCPQGYACRDGICVPAHS